MRALDTFYPLADLIGSLPVPRTKLANGEVQAVHMYETNLQNIGGARRQVEAASVPPRMGDLVTREELERRAAQRPRDVSRTGTVAKRIRNRDQVFIGSDNAMRTAGGSRSSSCRLMLAFYARSSWAASVRLWRLHGWRRANGRSGRCVSTGCRTRTGGHSPRPAPCPTRR